MKKRCLILSMITFLVLGTVSAQGEPPGGEMNCETPPFVTQTVEPNILIIFDNSGSMANIVWIDSYDRSVDHTTRLLPPKDDDDVIFAKEKGTCYIDHCRVTYKPSQKKVKLRYKKIPKGEDKEICSGGSYYTQWSDSKGYFYFDRIDMKFIDKSTYDNNPSNRIKIFLPYAEYSEGPISGGDTGAYSTWYDYDYMNWLFYDSTEDDRIALEQQHQNQRDLLTRILVAKKVVRDLVETTDDVRFGFMQFNGSNGGTLKAEVSSNKQLVLDAIGDTWKSGVWATGSTPLAEALEDAWDYFSDKNETPIQYRCQKNFVILMTDGYPSWDADNLGDLKGDWDEDGGGDECPEGEQGCYHGNGSDFLDDIAYYIYEHDLLPDESFPAMEGMQNIYTYTIGFTVINPLLMDTAFNGNGLAGFQGEWDNPQSPHYRRYFYTASNYTELKDALRSAFNEIINKISSGTAVAVQSTSTEAKRRLIRAKFLPEDWRGYLEAFKIPYTYGDVPLWEAGRKLKDRSEADRYIFTAVDDNPLDPVIPKGPDNVDMKRKILFTEDNSTATDAQLKTLSQLLEAANDDEAKKIIRYIRGSSEDGYRDRKGWKLGDIAYSSPVILDDVVYVGANDGMLHALDINTGEEKWAFIPNNLLPKLKNLARTDYCHEYFVDLSPKVAEIYVGGSLKKVLVGGERGGGDAFFALDITDPSPGGVKPMWEFRDPLLGESWTVPTLERCKFGEEEKWLAFVGSAFENEDSKGYLFAVDVLTGEKEGTELNLLGKPNNSLPSLRAIDWDLNGYTDRIYVGCLAEKLFVVHIGSEADPFYWKNEQIFTTEGGQPITIPTSLSVYEIRGEDYVGVYFGTGKFYTLADKTDTKVQSFYCIMDNNQKKGRGGLSDQTYASLCEPIALNWGWYIDFVENPGERVISSALVLAGYVFFTTFQPSDDPCEAGGIARLWVVNYNNGCVPAEPVIDINGDGVVDDSDKINGSVPRSIEIGYGIPSDIIYDPVENVIIIQTGGDHGDGPPGGGGGAIKVIPVPEGSRTVNVHSWREVID